MMVAVAVGVKASVAEPELLVMKRRMVQVSRWRCCCCRSAVGLVLVWRLPAGIK